MPGMAAAYAAGASGLPFGTAARLRGHRPAAAQPARRLHRLPVHGRAPRRGEGAPSRRGDHPRAEGGPRRATSCSGASVGVQKEAVLAAKRAIVTVEEIVDRSSGAAERGDPAAWVVSRRVPGARWRVPLVRRSATTPATTRSTRQWDAVARDRDTFTAWIARHVLGTADADEFRRSLRGARRCLRLRRYTADEMMTMAAARMIEPGRWCSSASACRAPPRTSRAARTRPTRS